MDAKELLVIVLYIGLITLVIVSIVLMLRLIKTLNKVDKVVDDCSLSSYSDARKVSGGSNSFASTNKRSC